MPRSRRGSPGPPNSQSKVLLLGESPWLHSIEASLEALEVLVLKAGWDVDLGSHIDRTTLAVIVTSSPPKSTLAQAIRKLRRVGPERAPVLFALIPDGAKADRVRELYRAGATAVLEWPRERSLFPRLLAEMASVEHVRGRAKRPDLALQRAVEAHLTLDAGLKRGVRIDCRKGVAFLSGRADSLWHQQRLEDVLSSVPGVRSVISHDLWVKPSGRSDRDLSRSVRLLLRNTSEIDDTTLSFSVRNGYLTIAGTVSDRRELQRVVNVMHHVKGLRGIENLTTISRTTQKRDHATAARIRQALRTVFPTEDISVAVFAGAAVLSGRVRLLATKQKIGEQVERDPAVARVINKLDVAPS